RGAVEPGGASAEPRRQRRAARIWRDVLGESSRSIEKCSRIRPQAKSTDRDRAILRRTGQRLVTIATEPPRECRRLFGLSQAALPTATGTRSRARIPCALRVPGLRANVSGN